MLAAAAIFAGGASQAHATAVDQIAIRLGATQLGYPSSYTIGTNPVWDASALRQGQLALAATTANVNTTAFVVSPVTPGNTNRTVPPNPQSATFRSQYLAAVQSALTSPTTRALTNVSVVTLNPTTGRFATNRVTGTLSPASTTPTLILNSVVAKMPNFGPAIVSNAVAATMAGTIGTNGIFIPTWGAAPKPSKANLSSSNNINLFNSRTASTQLSNAGKAASAALTAASKAYTKGTVNWQGFPTTGNPTNTSYLPNFGTTTLGQKGLTNNQIPNLTGLANAASAVAANAINGLGVGTGTTNAGVLYGQTQSNVASMTTALMKAAATFQATSTKNNTAAGNNFYTYGSISAAAFGSVTQVAGTNNYYAAVNLNDGPNDAVSSLLVNSVITGAVSAVKNSLPNVNAVASGVAQGFLATYLFTTTNAPSSMTNNVWLADYKTANTTFLNSAIQRAYGKTTTDFTGVINGQLDKFFTDYQSYVGSGMTNRMVFANVAGAAGINLATTNSSLLPLFNGIGTPVTDTTGL